MNRQPAITIESLTKVYTSKRGTNSVGRGTVRSTVRRGAAAPIQPGLTQRGLPRGCFPLGFDAVQVNWADPGGEHINHLPHHHLKRDYPKSRAVRIKVQIEPQRITGSVNGLAIGQQASSNREVQKLAEKPIPTIIATRRAAPSSFTRQGRPTRR